MFTITLAIPMDFPIHVDTISMGLSICLKGSQIVIYLTLLKIFKGTLHVLPLIIIQMHS